MEEHNTVSTEDGNESGDFVFLYTMAGIGAFLHAYGALVVWGIVPNVGPEIGFLPGNGRFFYPITTVVLLTVAYFAVLEAEKRR